MNSAFPSLQGKLSSENAIPVVFPKEHLSNCDITSKEQHGRLLV